MGYYSEVAYVAVGKKDDILAAIAAWRLNSPDKAGIHLDEVDIVPRGNEHLLVSFYADGTKWYDSFEGTQAHESFLLSLEDKPIAARFVRIGEDENDIETRTYGDGCDGFDDLYSYIYPVRSICIDFYIDPEQDIRKQAKNEDNTDPVSAVPESPVPALLDGNSG